MASAVCFAAPVALSSSRASLRGAAIRAAVPAVRAARRTCCVKAAVSVQGQGDGVIANLTNQDIAAACTPAPQPANQTLAMPRITATSLGQHTMRQHMGGVLEVHVWAQPSALKALCSDDYGPDWAPPVRTVDHRKLYGSPSCPHSCSPPALPPPQAPLVGGPAPDFTATAVFDQEFVETKLSQYKVSTQQ